MTGVVLPLVLAAVLSVVAVAAARPGHVPVATRALPPLGGPAGAAIAAVSAAGLLALTGQGTPHPGGDPGGRILASLTPAATSIPAGAFVLSREDSEPSWVTCGAGRSGWTPVGVSVEFSASLTRGQLIDGMDGSLAGEGWRAGGDARWTKPLPGGASAAAALDPGGQPGVWWLRVTAPAEGSRCP